MPPAIVPVPRVMDSPDSSLHDLDTEVLDVHEAATQKMKRNQKTVPFRFLALPAEIRLRVYALLFKLPSDYTADLDSNNHRRLAPLFVPLLLTSRQLHDEAAQFFYSINKFRLFPTQGKFFKSKRPLLSRLPRHYREHITKMELRLGPGWNKPPAGWKVTESLGLADAARLKKLCVFVECDPASNEIFRGFRTSDSFYTDFSVKLLRDVLYAGESIEEIEFDAYPSVKNDSPLMTALASEARAAGKRMVWGPQFQEQERLRKEECEKDISRISSLSDLSDAMAAVSISDGTAAVKGHGFGVHANLLVLSEA